MSAENTDSAPVGGSLADRVTNPDGSKTTGTNEPSPETRVDG